MPGFTVDDMVRVESALDPSYSHDGARLAFRSNPPGVPQVYVIDANGSGQRQLVAADETLGGLDADDPAVFAADAGHFAMLDDIDAAAIGTAGITPGHGIVTGSAGPGLIEAAEDR